MEPAVENFWREWAEIGRELLSYGREVQYGMSLVEVKFQAGDPAVIIRSKSIKKKYATDQEARDAINQILQDSSDADFDGARTYTVAYTKGKIKQVILDEYGNQLLK